MLCEYGCGKIAIFQYRNGKWCCNFSRNKCTEMKKKNSNGNKGSTRTEETKIKMRNSRKKQVITEEMKRKSQDLQTLGRVPVRCSAGSEKVSSGLQGGPGL